MKKPEITYLKNYQPPLFLVDSIDLTIDIFEDITTVHSQLKVRKSPEMPSSSNDFVLNGENVELVSIIRDGSKLEADAYQITEETLTVLSNPDAFALDIICQIKPQENTALEGLYKAEGIFLTQCEAEGFRRISYFPDRPDVMSRYQCTIQADKSRRRRTRFQL